jgi:uncharacterized membrane protein
VDEKVARETVVVHFPIGWFRIRFAADLIVVVEEPLIPAF